MPELLLFKYNHSTLSLPTPSVANLAALPKQFDLLHYNLDGQPWGKEELTNPWFRILVWLTVTPTELDVLLSPALPAMSGVTATTYEQYRGFYLNLTNPALSAWWADDTRAVPKFTMPAAMAVATVTSLTVTRTAISTGVVLSPGPALSIGP